MKEMALTDHLHELRSRVIRIVGILFVSFFVCYHFGEQIQNLLLLPLRSALGDDGKVVFLGLLDKVLTQFQLAFWSAIIVSSPLWFGQLWFFIKPGLYDHEVKIIRPFLFVSLILFWLGVSFGYFIVFPFTFETILGFGVQEVEAMMSLKDYIVLACKVLVFLGVLFQLPNLLMILGFMGIISGKKLANARRYVITGFAVLSAILTPPDPITMMALWIPMVVLYEIGILGVKLIVDPFQKKKNKDQDQDHEES
jgi:sec-independent protein translocase protein TatC